MTNTTNHLHPWDLLARVFSVEDIMTPRSELKVWKRDRPIDEILLEAQNPKLDILPIIDIETNKVIGILHDGKEELITEDWLISYDRPIPDLIHEFAERDKSDLLVFGEQETDVIGIVARADLNKSPARTYIYNLLSELEMMLAKKIRNHFDGKQETILEKLRSFDLSQEEIVRKLSQEIETTGKIDIDKLSKLCKENYRVQKYRDLELEIKRMESDNLVIDIVYRLELTELFKIIYKEKPLLESLGYSRAQLEKKLNSIEYLRNDVMHSVRSVIHREGGVKGLSDQIQVLLEILKSWKNMDNQTDLSSR